MTLHPHSRGGQGPSRRDLRRHDGLPASAHRDLRRHRGGGQAAAREGHRARREAVEREASEGIVEAYIHGGGRIGVLVEVNCLTDFVAEHRHFKEFAKEVAMQIPANPQTR